MSTPVPSAVVLAPQTELEVELREVVADIDAGDCFTLTPEMFPRDLVRLGAALRSRVDEAKLDVRALRDSPPVPDDDVEGDA